MALEHELFDDLLRFVIQFPIAENRYQITNAYRRALDERDAALARAEAAERRVAELEAQLSAWENIQRGAIERQEDIPWEALLVNFREPTVTERHYGDTLISLLEDSIEGQ